METYNIVCNNVWVEAIEQQGRSREVMAFILIDRVYELTKQMKNAVVDVYKRSGEPYYYSV